MKKKKKNGRNLISSSFYDLIFDEMVCFLKEERRSRGNIC